MSKILVLKSAAAAAGMLILAGCESSILQAGNADAGLDSKRIKDVDSISFGNIQSEKDHRLTAIGSVKKEIVETELGMLNTKYTVRTVYGKGTELAFTLQVESANPVNPPFLLEIEEIHKRRTEVFGYTVNVNGKEAYFRTYEEIAAGPNHFFVRIPRSLAPSGNMRITFRNEGDTPFSIGRIWAYSDFASLADSEKIYRRMPILSHALSLLGNIGVKGKIPTREDFLSIGKLPEETRENAWDEVSARFSQGSSFIPGEMKILSYVDYFYGSDRNLRDTVKNELDNVVKKNLAWQITLHGSQWGGHPSGSDGRGGNFYDIRYSQACYNSLKKKYYPTWPESPGGTIWPTHNEKSLNDFLAVREYRACMIIAEQLGWLAAEKTERPPVYIVGDQGPSYWDIGDIFGDFSPAMVADAARDGIRISYEKGLNHEARMWMFRNLSRFCDNLGKATASGIGRDYIAVHEGNVIMPRSQLSDDAYSHPFYNPDSPMFDDRWGNWQTGINANQWSSGEPLEHLNPAYFDYVASIGKLTCANCERQAMVDYYYLDKLFQWGFQHVTIFNTYSGDIEPLMEVMKGMDKRPALPPTDYPRKLLDVKFARDWTLGPEKQLLKSENLDLSSNMKKRLMFTDSSKGGLLAYRIDNAGKPLPGGLKLRLYLANYGDNKQDTGSILVVSAGRSLDSLKTVCEYNFKDLKGERYWPFPRYGEIELGNVLMGLSEGIVQIQFKLAGGEKISNLSKFDIVMPWDRKTGHIAGETFNNKEMRTMRLWIQQRAVFERLMERYKAKNGDAGAVGKAESILASGRLVEAYAYLSGEYSHLLPARFAVRGHGPLGRYPVVLKLKDEKRKVLAEILRLDRDAFEISFSTREEQTCRIELARLTPGDKYGLSQTGNNRYFIQKSATGTLLADDKGMLAVDVKLAPAAISGESAFLAASTGRVPSRRLIALAIGQNQYEVQDKDLFLFNPLFIPAADGATRNRRKDGDESDPGKAEMPRTGDKVEIVLDDLGNASELKSTYGQDAGAIKSFQEPSVFPEPCNGIIELDNGKRYEFSYRIPIMTKFSVPGLKGAPRANSIDDICKALKTGMKVRIEYSPYCWNGSLPRITSLSLVEENRENK